MSIDADYVSGGELFTHLYQREKFAEREVRIYIAEIILALEHLHKVRLTASLSRNVLCNPQYFPIPIDLSAGVVAVHKTLLKITSAISFIQNDADTKMDINDASL